MVTVLCFFTESAFNSKSHRRTRRTATVRTVSLPLTNRKMKKEVQKQIYTPQYSGVNGSMYANANRTRHRGCVGHKQHSNKELRTRKVWQYTQPEQEPQCPQNSKPHLLTQPNSQRSSVFHRTRSNAGHGHPRTVYCPSDIGCDPCIARRAGHRHIVRCGIRQDHATAESRGRNHPGEY